MNTRGNTDILDLHKTAFLCSRSYPAGAVLRIYDWAKEMRASGMCVISGFHSLLERDVLDILLNGTQSLILVSARGLQKRYPAPIQRALDDERLLIATPFPESVKHITAATASKRNAVMLSHADRIVVGYVSPGGGLDKVLSGVSPEKEIVRLSD